MKAIIISQNWLVTLKQLFTSNVSKSANKKPAAAKELAKEALSSPEKEEWNYLLQLTSL